MDHHLSQGFFQYIDLFFAQRVLKRLKSDDEAHAALLATLFAFSRQGHLALDLSDEMLEGSLKELVQKGAATFPAHAIADMIHGSTSSNAWICRRGSYYYLQKNWAHETHILEQIERLKSCIPAIPMTLSTVELSLNVAQKKALENAMNYSLSLLTGGPGTGKTFTAAELVKACLQCCPTLRILLTAPTGKAVSQLEGNLKSVLIAKAGTLHATLGIKPHVYEEEETSLLPYDLVIVDECSMIDAKVFSRLLCSVPNGARLVLIGDKDQLPPVEAGSIFADLIEMDRCPSTHLTECLRSDRNEILALAHHIKEGNEAAALHCLQNGSDVTWAEFDDKQLLEKLWREYNKRFPGGYSELPQAGQLFEALGRFGLLSSMRQGTLGVDAINRYFLYQSMRQAQEDSWWIAPIMITRNDYELELYNGDLGFLVRKFTDDLLLRQFGLDDYFLLLDRKGNPRQIAALNVTAFEYSYCLSVHKSQGSEYDEAVILIPPGSENFGREILYTAVTRSRYKVTLICSKELFTQAVRSSSRKKSGLCSRP